MIIYVMCQKTNYSKAFADSRRLVHPDSLVRVVPLYTNQKKEMQHFWTAKKNNLSTLFFLLQWNLFLDDGPQFLAIYFILRNKLFKYILSVNLHAHFTHWTSFTIIRYCIWLYYRAYPYKHAVKQLRSLQITASVLFVYLIKAHVVGTHLNCIDLSMQFKWVPITYAFIKKIERKLNRKTLH